MKVVNNGLTIEFDGTMGHFPKEFVVSALKKQITKKPVIPFDSIYQEYECPMCPHKVDKTQQYCDKCGQALDWSEE
jgi:hypothetical protein